MPSLSITITSPPRQWKPIAIFYGNLKINHLKWFGRLRNFVCSLNRPVALKVNLIGWPKKTLMWINNYKGIPLCDQVPVIEHLELRAFDDLRCYESLLDCLFWTCHPTKLYLKSCNKLNKTVIEKLCEMLMEREEGPCCCSSTNSKCWRHHLKNVEVGCFELKNKVERPLHWKTLLNLLPSLGEHQGICFKLNW